MTRSEFFLVIVLRVTGISALFAIPAIFLPHAWMNAIHNYLGLGDLPNIPIVQYLARSLSAFYAILGVILIYVSRDVRRYRSIITLLAIIFCVLGSLLLGIDLSAGMPADWTATEGPITVVVGLLLLGFQRASPMQSYNTGSSG